jgi:multisubunit Na+/H+ antiporter MnhC subunit
MTSCSVIFVKNNSETLLFASIGEVDSVAQSSSEVLYSNPLPHVLILTAIVVGVATLAIGLSLVVRVREVYGTIEEDKIEEYDRIYYKEILERQ